MIRDLCRARRAKQEVGKLTEITKEKRKMNGCKQLSPPAWADDVVDIIEHKGRCSSPGRIRQCKMKPLAIHGYEVER